MKLELYQAKLIRSCIEDLDATIYEKYSGRCMYGKQCFGITVEQGGSSHGLMLALGSALSEDDEENLVSILAQKARMDSMGLGVIIYFPGIEWPDEDVIEDEDEEDDGEGLDSDK